mgnify:CR=1 FL=1
MNKKIKILAFRTDRIGDLINSSSFFKSLNSYYDNAEIDLVCSSYNCEIAKRYDFIKNVYIYNKNPNILYANIDNANPNPNNNRPVLHEIYRSDDAGESWYKVSADGESIGNRSNYYGQIIIDPNDHLHIYVLSPIVHESFDGGKTWGQYIRYGGDNHVLWINHNDSRHMMMGYDYGMAITHDQGKNWYHPDEIPMGQFYAIGVDMDYPYNVYGGTQDFGSWKGPSTKKGRFPIRFEDWEHVNGGDGFYNLVDPDDSRWLYSSSQFGHITRIDQKTGSRKTIVDDRNDDFRFNWNTPLLISPHNSKTLYVGAQLVLRCLLYTSDAADE